MVGKKTAVEWSEIYGIKILDPDGWRMPNSPKWDAAINVAEWEMLMGLSTIVVIDPEKYRQAWLD